MRPRVVLRDRGGVTVSDFVTSVYGGRATVTFKTGSHVYTVQVPEKGITDLWQPSVTGIIRVLSKADVLVPWALKEMTKRVEEILATDPSPSLSR